MSFEITTHEQLTINNTNGQAEKIVKALLDYILQFNRMQAVESIAINNLSLKLNGKSVVIKDVHETEYDTFYAMTGEGLVPHYPERKLWNDDDPFMIAAANAGKARWISFEADFCVLQILGADYGVAYWNKVLTASENTAGMVKCKAIEYYDTDDNVTVVNFDKNGFKDAAFRNHRASDFAGITWYDYNFSLSILDGDELENGSPEYEKLVEFGKVFVEKYGLGNVSAKPYKGDFTIEAGLEINNGGLYQLMEDIKAFKKLCDEVHGEFGCHAKFVAEDGFACAEIRAEEDDIVFCKL